MVKAFEIQVPGRVNLLGEHTDYNGLPVLPAAIEPVIHLTGSIRQDQRIVVCKSNSGESPVEFSLDGSIPRHPQGHWINYVKAGMQGVVDSYHVPKASLCGCEIKVSGSIPQGVGLSSSSALVVASALAFLTTNNLTFDRLALAEQMAQAEHYVGTRGGGMDQAACLLSQSGHALLIRFFPLRIETVQISDSVRLVICDSMVRAKKSEKNLLAYNLRALECRFATLLLHDVLQKQGLNPDFKRLGDLLNESWGFTYESLSTLIEDTLQEQYTYQQIVDSLDSSLVDSLLQDYGFKDNQEYPQRIFACGKRFRHVINDAVRVEQGKSLLQNGDVVAFGQLMNEGHMSARHDFEISCPELDRLTELAIHHGAFGARLTGAGFGGCTVNLVNKNEVESFRNSMFNDFYASRNLAKNPDEVIWISRPGNGARVKLIN